MWFKFQVIIQFFNHFWGVWLIFFSIRLIAVWWICLITHFFLSCLRKIVQEFNLIFEIFPRTILIRHLWSKKIMKLYNRIRLYYIQLLHFLLNCHTFLHLIIVILVIILILSTLRWNFRFYNNFWKISHHKNISLSWCIIFDSCNSWRYFTQRRQSNVLKLLSFLNEIL